VILLDSDVLLIELRYVNDPKFSINRQALDQLHADQIQLAVTSQALLETIGILSFNVSPSHISQLPRLLSIQFKLNLLPDFQQCPEYANCTVQEIIIQMARQMALGDAVQAVQIARYASFATCLLTWNARHFQGKVVIPVFTPHEWLSRRLGGTP
jgi:hypothetical protein